MINRNNLKRTVMSTSIRNLHISFYPYNSPIPTVSSLFLFIVNKCKRKTYLNLKRFCIGLMYVLLLISCSCNNQYEFIKRNVKRTRQLQIYCTHKFHGIFFKVKSMLHFGRRNFVLLYMENVKNLLLLWVCLSADVLYKT